MTAFGCELIFTWSLGKILQSQMWGIFPLNGICICFCQTRSGSQWPYYPPWVVSVMQESPVHLPYFATPFLCTVTLITSFSSELSLCKGKKAFETDLQIAFVLLAVIMYVLIWPLFSYVQFCAFSDMNKINTNTSFQYNMKSKRNIPKGICFAFACFCLHIYFDGEHKGK